MLSRRPAALPHRSRLEAGAIVLLLIFLLALFVWPVVSASPASAATPGVELSDDGVNFSPTYTGSLFDNTALMVPSTTWTARFWVKNASTEPAYLRVSIGGVTGTGTPLSSALKIKGATSLLNGSWVGVEAATPCYVLAQGQLLAPGGIVRVDAFLTLGDLTGTSGQETSVDFDILAGLSSAATGTMPSTTCLGNSSTVPGTGGGGGGHAGRGTPGGGTGSELPAGTADGDSILPTLPNGSAFAGDEDSVGILDTNTGRLYQEWFVALWIAAVLAGGGLCLLLARRRFATAEETEEEEVTGWLADVPMSGRKAWSTT